jgi:voltage-gated potassium channel
VVRNLERHGVSLTVISPEAICRSPSSTSSATAPRRSRCARRASRRRWASSPASDNDTNNLSIAMTAKEVNPELFVVVRQNRVANEVLFDAYDADFTMVPSRIVARECLALITSPLLRRFLQLVRAWPDARAASLPGNSRSSVGSACRWSGACG